MIFKILKNLKKSTRGAAAIETALIFPIIIVLSFGFFEFCQVVFTQSVLSYSAAQASRYAMVNISVSNLADATAINAKAAEIESYAKESFILINSDNVSNFSVTITPGLAAIVNVSMDYNYTTSIPMLPNYDFTLTGQSDSFIVRPN